ncbi:MAG: carbohydrate ABC transporter permease [Chloroflexi bacterium]|nr:MAG: carbohydrate ABC transporter permease [Chloroflexota bacterium]TME96431.1 MAG: carbohydrate ABC transporter permease [Chloroflexota bacterium]
MSVATASTAISHRRSPPKRWNLYVAAVAISLFILIPIYLIAVAAFTPRAVLNGFPKPLLPVAVSTDTMQAFLSSRGVGQSVVNSLLVGIITLVLSTVLGAPAGYALARFAFRGRDSFQLLILMTRAFPIAILAVPLTVTFINWNLYDTLWAVALVHTALALPTTVLITASVFVAVPVDLEEAALTLGCTPIGAFTRVAMPLALPGLAAASIFTFVLSWNEVFASVILTVQNRTLPAQVLTQLDNSPLAYKFAGGFALIVPALIFIFFIRRYLFNMWGRIVR